MMQQIKTSIAVIILLYLSGCAGTGSAPVDNRTVVKEAPATTIQRQSTQQKSSKPSKPTKQDNKGFHIVQRGDTLYSIAWRYNFDYKEVANWNEIKKPFTIFPGQVIRLKPRPGIQKKKGTPLKTETAAKDKISKKPVQPKPVKPVPKKQIAEKKQTAPKPSLPKGPIKWDWPTRGKLVKIKSPKSKKGINISGKNGQVIKAAAGGKVVYSGSGLIGYGKLIIIKHSETYLSAYAYNSKLLVKEGDVVNNGQSISQMGQDNTGRSVLHFEIRKNGKPVDPIKHLPKLRS